MSRTRGGKTRPVSVKMKCSQYKENGEGAKTSGSCNGGPRIDGFKAHVGRRHRNCLHRDQNQGVWEEV